MRKYLRVTFDNAALFLYTTAVPKPSSAKFNTWKMEANKLFHAQIQYTEMVNQHRANNKRQQQRNTMVQQTEDQVAAYITASLKLIRPVR